MATKAKKGQFAVDCVEAAALRQALIDRQIDIVLGRGPLKAIWDHQGDFECGAVFPIPMAKSMARDLVEQLPTEGPLRYLRHRVAAALLDPTLWGEEAEPQVAVEVLQRTMLAMQGELKPLVDQWRAASSNVAESTRLKAQIDAIIIAKDLDSTLIYGEVEAPETQPITEDDDDKPF